MPKMRRFVLTLKEARPLSSTDIVEVEQNSRRILDRTGRSLKVEAPDQSIDHLCKNLPNWHVESEIEYKIPDTRRFVQDPLISADVTHSHTEAKDLPQANR